MGGPSISRAALLSHCAALEPMLLLLDVLDLLPDAEASELRLQSA